MGDFKSTVTLRRRECCLGQGVSPFQLGSADTRVQALETFAQPYHVADHDRGGDGSPEVYAKRDARALGDASKETFTAAASYASVGKYVASPVSVCMAKES